MLKLSEVLELVKSAGLSVTLADEDKLKVIPREKLTPELHALLVKHKPEIIAHLNGWAADTGANPHWRWQVIFTDGSARIATFVPPVTWSEIKESYPNATTGYQIPDSDQSESTNQHG